MDEIVERALNQGALWDEVKDRLKTNAFGMSGSQQQRLCIAALPRRQRLDPHGRALLDARPHLHRQDRGPHRRPQTAVLDRDRHPQHAAGRPRVRQTAFFTVEVSDDDHRTGRVVEFDDTEKIFTNPSDSRTEAYVTGKVGLVACPTRPAPSSSKSSQNSSTRPRGAAHGGHRPSTGRSRPCGIRTRPPW